MKAWPLVLIACGAARQGAALQEGQVPAPETAMEAAPEEEEEQGQEPPDTQEQAGWDFSGFLDARYRLRRQTRTDTSDHDLWLSARFDLSGPGAAAATADPRFVFDGLLSADLDGDGGPRDSFYGLQNTRHSRLDGFVYQAWVESRAVLDDTGLRFGRQEIHREDALWFDGLLVEHRATDALSLNLYGGAPVHFFESNRSGDLLAGAGAGWQVSPRLRLAADEVYLREDVADLSGRENTTRDLLSILSGSWRAGRNGLLRGSASWLGDRDRRQELAAYLQWPEQSWWSTLRLRRQSDYGEAVATELSPLAGVLGDVAPYWTGSFEVHHAFTADLDLGAGVAARRLERSSDEGPTNREFERSFVLLSLDRFPVAAMDLGLRADFWNSSGINQTAAGAYLGVESADAWRAEIGTDFALYRFDAFTGREYLDDRQYYLRLRAPVRDNLRVSARYVQDRSQFGVDHLFETAIGLEF